jgi:hypothetical protein
MQRLFDMAMLGLGKAITARFGNMRLPSISEVRGSSDMPIDLVGGVIQTLNAIPCPSRIGMELKTRFRAGFRFFMDTRPQNLAFVATRHEDHFVILSISDHSILLVHKSRCTVEEGSEKASTRYLVIRSPLPAVRNICVGSNGKDWDWWQEFLGVVVVGQRQ